MSFLNTVDLLEGDVENLSPVADALRSLEVVGTGAASADSDSVPGLNPNPDPGRS